MPELNWIKLVFRLTIGGLIGLGLLFFGLGAEVSLLSCSRLKTNQVECRLERRFLGLVPVSTELLQDVATTTVVQDCNNGCVYWVNLTAEGGSIRLTRFATYNRTGVIADQQLITAYLQGDGLTRFEHCGSLSFALLLSSVLLFVAAAFMWRWR